jgi:hypothetical protein
MPRIAKVVGRLQRPHARPTARAMGTAAPVVTRPVAAGLVGAPVRRRSGWRWAQRVRANTRNCITLRGHCSADPLRKSTALPGVSRVAGGGDCRPAQRSEPSGAGSWWSRGDSNPGPLPCERMGVNSGHFELRLRGPALRSPVGRKPRSAVQASSTPVVPPGSPGISRKARVGGNHSCSRLPACRRVLPGFDLRPCRSRRATGTSCGVSGSTTSRWPDGRTTDADPARAPTCTRGCGTHGHLLKKRQGDKVSFPTQRDATRKRSVARPVCTQ